MTAELALQVENLLREHRHFRSNATLLIQILVLPTHGYYECWQMVRRIQARTGLPFYIGVHGRWDAFCDVNDYFDKSTGGSIESHVEPRITWSEVNLAQDVAEALICQMRSLQISLVVPSKTTGGDGIRHEIQMRDPEGSASIKCSLSWSSTAPEAWRTVEVLARATISEIAKGLDVRLT